MILHRYVNIIIYQNQVSPILKLVKKNVVINNIIRGGIIIVSIFIFS